MPLIQKYLRKIDARFFWKILKNSFKSFVFPVQCLHCDQSLLPDAGLLCLDCGSYLSLMNHEERCRTCFHLLSDALADHCHFCQTHPFLFTASASAFDYIGPAATLVKNFKYGLKSYLKEGMAAALLMQFQRLDWPLPDIIVPVPLSWMRHLERGFNQSLLLAQELGRYLNRPVVSLLKRRSGDLNQASLPLKQRQEMETESFYLSKGAFFEGKTLLLIDDVMTSGSTLNKCAEVLQAGHPKSLYAMTVCRA